MVGLLQVEVLRQLCAHLGQWQVLVEARSFDVAERHDLDEGYPHVPRVRPPDHGLEFVFVDPFERNDIDFDGESGPLRRVDAGQHAGEIAAPSDRLESSGIERIQRNVDAPHAAACEIVCEPRQLRAVRG